MKSLGTELPLSIWLEAICAEIGHETAKSFEFRLTLTEATQFIDVLRAASGEAKRLEALADSAPRPALPDNVLLFRPRKTAMALPADGGAA